MQATGLGDAKTAFAGLEEAPAALAVVDRDLTIGYANAAFGKAIAAAAVGQPLSALPLRAQDREALERMVRRAFHGSPPPPLEITLPGPGGPHTWRIVAFTHAAHVALLLTDLTGELRALVEARADAEATRALAERAAQRLDRLWSLTDALSAASTPIEVADAIVFNALPTLSAAAVVVHGLDPSGERIELLSGRGFPREELTRIQSLPLSGDEPASRAARSRAPVASGKLLALPLVARDRLVGAITVGFADPRAIDLDSRRHAEALAHECALALERTRLAQAESRARDAADQDRRRVELMARATGDLAGAESVRDALRRLVGLMVPGLADVATAVAVDADGRATCFASTHPTAVLVEREGKPVLDAPTGTTLRGTLRLAMEASDGRLLGHLLLGRTISSARFAGSDAAIAADIARRAAEALAVAQAREDAERALQAQAANLALLDALFDNAPVGLCFLDAHLHYVRVNAHLATINGKPPEAHIGRAIRDVLPDLSPEVENELRSVLATGRPIVGVEIASPGGEGGRRWIASYYPVRVAGERPVGVGIVVHEVTQLKRAEDALRRQTAMYEAMLRAQSDMGEGVIIADAGIITHANDAFCQIVGHPREEVIGSSLLQLVAPEERIAVADRLVSRDAATMALSATLLHRSGRRVEAEAAWRSLSGAPAGRAIGVIRDVTDQRRAEAELAVARREVAIAEKMAALGTLVAGVAHEIRTPLAYIANHLELSKIALERAAKEGSPASEVAETIESWLAEADEGVTRINGLVRDLRRFTRSEPGVRTTAPLHEVVRDGVRLFRAANRPVVEIDEDLRPTPLASLDKAAIQQVVINLLENAVDATPKGARVRVATDVADGRARLVVEDRGRGIPEGVRNDIWDLFFTTKAHGTGLGLAIVKRIVEQHEGTIELDSPPGGPTRFVATFPLAQSK